MATDFQEECRILLERLRPPPAYGPLEGTAHDKGILHWFHARIPHGLIEGMNRPVQAAIAKVRGYRKPKNLIPIACFIAGALDFNAAPGLAGLPP